VTGDGTCTIELAVSNYARKRAHLDARGGSGCLVSLGKKWVQYRTVRQGADFSMITVSYDGGMDTSLAMVS